MKSIQSSDPRKRQRSQSESRLKADLHEFKSEIAAKLSSSDRRNKLNKILLERTKITENMTLDEVILANLAVIDAMRKNKVSKQEIKELKWNVPVRLLNTEYFSLQGTPSEIVHRMVS